MLITFKKYQLYCRIDRMGRWNYTMNIGKNLIEYRKKFGYTQKKLSIKTGITQQIISNYERNVTIPSLKFLQTVADIYEVSLDKLIGRKNQSKNGESIEYKILNIIDTFDETEKQLSYSILKAIEQNRSKNYGK